MSRSFNVDDYIDVQERIVRFWSEYPDGRIETEMVTLPGEFDQVVFVARVYRHRDHPHPDATGWAAEQASQTGANRTSWHENCETSAIGRALANMGYAISREDRPSRQEMTKVQRGQPHDSQPAPRRQATPDDMHRISESLKGPLTSGAYNLLRREIDQLGIADDPVIGALLYEVEERRRAAAERSGQLPVTA